MFNQLQFRTDINIIEVVDFGVGVDAIVIAPDTKQDISVYLGGVPMGVHHAHMQYVMDEQIQLEHVIRYKK